MADSPIRSADRAYYRSSQPLNLNKLREGRKNAAPNPSYRQRMNDSTASSNKYYQSAQPAKVEAPVEVEAVKAKPKKVVELRASTRAASKVIDAFADDATDVIVAGKQNMIDKVRTAVDLAVGRGDITRAQADSVSFSVEAAKPKKVKKAEVKEEEGVVGEVGEHGEVGEPGIEEPIAPAPVDEKDIASMFGIDDDSDD